jgi:uncharacterized protein YjiS (DUF1127 family)
MPAILSLSIAAAAPLVRAGTAVGSSLIRRVAQFGRALKNRRAAASLAGFDDRMLADIGITRSDLRDAYSEPLWHDPTDVLAWRASERRLRRRSAVVRSDEVSQPRWLRPETPADDRCAA